MYIIMCVPDKHDFHSTASSHLVILKIAMLYLFILVNCFTPPTPENGSIVNYTNTREGAIVNFTCDYGFCFSDKDYSTCASDGVWTPSFLCQQILGTN